MPSVGHFSFLPGNWKSKHENHCRFIVRCRGVVQQGVPDPWYNRGGSAKVRLVITWLDIKCMKRTAPKKKYTTCTWRAALKSWLKYSTDKVGRINYNNVVHVKTMHQCHARPSLPATKTQIRPHQLKPHLDNMILLLLPCRQQKNNWLIFLSQKIIKIKDGKMRVTCLISSSLNLGFVDYQRFENEKVISQNVWLVNSVAKMVTGWSKNNKSPAVVAWSVKASVFPIQ